MDSLDERRVPQIEGFIYKFGGGKSAGQLEYERSDPAISENGSVAQQVQKGRFDGRHYLPIMCVYE